ncbi:MAG: ATP phosphoribosyltransferase regulatory subunit [Proteobacteria bacterium]|nr:MAG: ATP phosphoribosyltransferase regulatory subunit [Pseudomonadota bacterium]
MNNWLLPDGINESLPAEAESLETLGRKLLDLYRGWGYRFVMTPLVEYLESLSVAMGSQLDLQTFKITDQTNGRLMGVRADITTQVARIDSHRMAMPAGQPNRLCYMGLVLRTHSDVAGGSRSPIQIGAELFGHAGLESDYEVIRLMLETLSVVGAKDVLLDLGHVGILRGLIAKIGLDEAQQEVLLDMLARKSLPEISEWLQGSGLDPQSCELLSCLPNLHGEVSFLDTAKQQLAAAGEEVLAAIEYLQQITSRLQQDYPELKINLDLSEMRGYAYHTGIVYSAYVAGNGREIARGGRYDDIGKHFGNARPATGFTSNLRTLVSLGGSSAASATQGILAPAVDDAALQQLIDTLRAQGEIVVRQLVPLEQLSVQAQGCNRILEQQSGQWQVVAVS